MRKFVSPAFILGNGPSLRGFDFTTKLHGYVTFGMNLAYRFWHEVNWYPNYYSCLDKVVGLAHTDDILHLVHNAELYGIRKFLLRHNVVEALSLGNDERVNDFDQLLTQDSTFFRGYWASTGSLTAAWAARLGYKRLVLLGVDASYDKYVEGAVHINELLLQLVSQPRCNPNYFFDEYQQTGDLYHVPFRHHPDFTYEDQLMGWHMIRPQLHASGTLVVNANPASRVDAFPKCTFEGAAHALHLASRRLKRAQHKPGLTKNYARRSGVILDTVGLALDMCDAPSGVFMDIGAYHGQAGQRALSRGWRVCAAEADPETCARLRQRFAGMGNVYIESHAVSCIGGRTYPWFSHPDNARLNAMQDFTGKGVCTGKVQTVTVGEMAHRAGVTHVSILFLDTEGFEFMALRGIPFNTLQPDCIVCAWDNSKSLPLGNDLHDKGSFLLAQGYHVFMSEWHPDLASDFPLQWRRLLPYPAKPAHVQAWGHFIAFRCKPAYTRFRVALNANIHTGEALLPSPIPPLPRIKRMPYVIQY